MKTLIEKEIRLLLPAFAAALVLAVVPIWILPTDGFEYGQNTAAVGYFFLFGIVLLALSSFGREISLKTVSFALAQPLERGQIWWTKVGVLLVFLGAAFDVWLLSVTYCSSFQPIRVLPPEALALCGLAIIALTAGALWLTLLLRQVVAALALSVLVPMAAVITLKAFGGEDWMSVALLAIYSVAGLIMARLQFLLLQDTAWTGGAVSIGRGRAAEKASALRIYSPWEELIRKELQLHQFTLAGMAGLFVLHLGVILLRKAGAHTFNHTILSSLEMFGVVWLFVPLLAGGQSVAEERQLNTLDSLLCLPVTRRAQFGIKLFFVLLLGGVLGTVLLCTAEEIGVALGAGANVGVLGTIHSDNLFAMAGFFMLLSLLGFYGSTLTRGLVPALAVGIVLTILFYMGHLIAWQAYFAFGTHLWPVIGPAVMLAAVLWLAWGNFRWVFESGRRWRRNILGLLAVLLLVCGATAATYHRVWELVMPSDLPHGTARLAPGKTVMHGAQREQFEIVLPDTRLWIEQTIYRGRRPDRVAEGRFANGSNWVDALSINGQTVALKSDGTLWISTNIAQSAELVQFGSETGWQSMARLDFDQLLLLQRDGTLWRWGGRQTGLRHYLGLQNFSPRRLGTDSDWQQIVDSHAGVYAWKADGRAWAFRESDDYAGWVYPPSWVQIAPGMSVVHQIPAPPPTPAWVEVVPGVSAVRAPALDSVHFQSIVAYQDNRIFGYGRVGVREDGTLWYWDTSPEWPVRRSEALRLKREGSSHAPLQIGKDSNWASVQGDALQLVARKTDGSIWRWKSDFGNQNNLRGAARRGPDSGLILPEALQKRPLPLGTHHDWIALGGPSRNGLALALAADGTLWSWPNVEYYARDWDDHQNWLAPSRKPVPLENILDAH